MHNIEISTHSLLAEADYTEGGEVKHRLKFQLTASLRRPTKQHRKSLFLHLYFNSQPPCGGRHSGKCHRPDISYFNSQPPCGGRPHTHLHPPKLYYFNSQPPCGGRPCPSIFDTSEEIISTHSLLAEADSFSFPVVIAFEYFNSQPPCGGRLVTAR